MLPVSVDFGSEFSNGGKDRRAQQYSSTGVGWPLRLGYCECAGKATGGIEGGEEGSRSRSLVLRDEKVTAVLTIRAGYEGEGGAVTTEETLHEKEVAR